MAGRFIILLLVVVPCILISKGCGERARSDFETDFFTEVSHRRSQGKELLYRALENTTYEPSVKVYSAMLAYYDKTESLFPVHEQQGVRHAEIDMSTYVEESVLFDLIQQHIVSTIKLYAHGISTDISSEGKNSLLVTLPALLAQKRDLEALNVYMETNLSSLTE